MNVAQINSNASAAQTLKAMQTAEEYDGPSLLIAYSPCIAHGIKGGLTNSFAQGKLVRVIKGSVIDVVVDIRKKSPTYGEHFTIELNEENKNFAGFY